MMDLTDDSVRVTNLVFSRLGNLLARDNVRIEMTVSLPTSTDVIYTDSFSFQTAVSLRR